MREPIFQPLPDKPDHPGLERDRATVGRQLDSAPEREGKAMAFAFDVPRIPQMCSDGELIRRTGEGDL